MGAELPWTLDPFGSWPGFVCACRTNDTGLITQGSLPFQFSGFCEVY